MSKTILFQAIQFSQTVLIQPTQFCISIYFVYTQLNVKTVLFQTIQFNVSTVAMSKIVPFQNNSVHSLNINSINMHFSSIWPINRTLSGATTLGQGGLGSDGNEGVLRIPQSITRTSPSDCLELYSGRSLVGSYPSAEMQSVYSTAPADWATNTLGKVWTPLFSLLWVK